ncbi:MAG: prolyl oligopeptidase family serine peptidase, partial [Lentisphaerae bacterium]|nr:prolyl oligopeptidase family serine peptidase [Lentisphaerota bacterium]
MIRRQWQRWLAGGVAVCLVMTAARAWRVDHADPPREPALRAQIRRFAKELRALQILERKRAWAYPGLASRQASWNAVKAQLILHQTKPNDPKTVASKALRDRLRGTFFRLMVARSQSLYGVREMREEGGAKLRACWSRIDGTLQPYSLRFPHGYDPTVSWPLVVSLHGHGWYRPFQGHPAPDRRGVFSLSPHGRGATDYKEQGEEAVLGAIEDVCLDYNIDRERIYVTGGSMGGTGSWQLGCGYADRFAGIMPIAGNADSQAWTERWGWNQSFDSRNTAFRDWLQETHSARAHARNLVNLPTYVVHGSGDSVVPPEHARRMVAALRAFDATVEFREFPGVAHGGFPGVLTREGLAWMCGRVRERYPRRVLWRSALLRTGKAYWVRFVRLQRPV